MSLRYLPHKRVHTSKGYCTKKYFPQRRIESRVLRKKIHACVFALNLLGRYDGLSAQWKFG